MKTVEENEKLKLEIEVRGSLGASRCYDSRINQLCGKLAIYCWIDNFSKQSIKNAFEVHARMKKFRCRDVLMK